LLVRESTVKLSLFGADGGPKVGNERRIGDRIRPLQALATARTGSVWGGFVQSKLNVTVPLDEVFVSINGKTHYLWRAVDQEGNVLDILVQARRDALAARKFFRKRLNGLQYIRLRQNSDAGW